MLTYYSIKIGLLNVQKVVSYFHFVGCGMSKKCVISGDVSKDITRVCLYVPC